MHLKISSAKWRPFSAGGDELMLIYGYEFGVHAAHDIIMIIGDLERLDIWQISKTCNIMSWHGNSVQPLLPTYSPKTHTGTPMRALMLSFLLARTSRIILFKPNDAYMGPQIKPLPEPMLTYCQSDHNKHNSMSFHLQLKSFNSRKRNLKFEKLLANVACQMVVIFLDHYEVTWNRLARYD